MKKMISFSDEEVSLIRAAISLRISDLSIKANSSCCKPVSRELFLDTIDKLELIERKFIKSSGYFR